MATAWDPWKPSRITIREAVALQRQLARKVSTRSRLPKKVSRVAGLDATYVSGKTLAAAALLDYPSLEVREVAMAMTRTPFPYVPGLLAFREAPGVLKALKKLRSRPHVCLADGHGVAHPRKCGLACLLGIYSGIPTIGVAKSHLYGDIINHRILDETGAEIGRIVQTSKRKNLYVSVGHKISLDDAVSIVRGCLTKEGLKPIMAAHEEVSSRKWSLSK